MFVLIFETSEKGHDCERSLIILDWKDPKAVLFIEFREIADLEVGDTAGLETCATSFSDVSAYIAGKPLHPLHR